MHAKKELLILKIKDFLKLFFAMIGNVLIKNILSKVFFPYRIMHTFLHKFVFLYLSKNEILNLMCFKI